MKILVSTLPIRKKFINAYGENEAFVFFDYIVDATSVFVEDSEEEDYSDEIINEKIIKFKKLQDLISFLENKNIEMLFLFHPRPNSITQNFLNYLNNNQIKCSLVANKATERTPAKILNPFSLLKFLIKYIYYKIKKQFSKNYVEYYFTNSIFFEIKQIHKYCPNKIIKIKHLNTVNMVAKEEDLNIGVFVDQYLPFHTEGECAKEKIDPKKYYENIENYLLLAKKNYNLDEIIILCHPNSLKKELNYIKHHKTVYGDTYSYIKKSKIVFGHYSNALTVALQYNKTIKSLLLPFLPECRNKDLFELSEKLQIDIEVFENNKITYIKKNSILRKIINCTYRSYFSLDADDLITTYKKFYMD